MAKTEKQTVHDWSSGTLTVYEIEVPADETPAEPPLPDTASDPA